MKKLLLASSLLFCSLPSLANSQLPLLTEWMQGHFDSSKQAQADKDFFEIHLNMKQIWSEDKNSVWLYVEQAAKGYLDKPYRQRVYKLEQLTENEFASHVYLLPDAKAYIGAHNQVNKFSQVSPEQLTIKQGCTVYLTWNDAAKEFSGSTKKDECKSKLRGATYATSTVTVTQDAIVSWDQGFDNNNKQVWGAVKAGYVFDKTK